MDDYAIEARLAQQKYELTANRQFETDPAVPLMLDPKLREFGVPFSVTVMGDVKRIEFAGKAVFQVPENVTVETVTLRIDPVRRTVVGMTWNERPESRTESTYVAGELHDCVSVL